jgi:hypothetical protein
MPLSAAPNDLVQEELFCFFYRFFILLWQGMGVWEFLSANRKKTPVLSEVFSSLVPLRFRPSGSGFA